MTFSCFFLLCAAACSVMRGGAELAELNWGWLLVLGCRSDVWVGFHADKVRCMRYV